MKTITLTQNQVALVDDDDYEYLSQFSWHASKGSSTFYARRTIRQGKKFIKIAMQNLIMKPSAGMVVDHINHDGLDNRKENLRIATPKENARNRTSQHSELKYKGLKRTRNNKRNPYLAVLRADGKWKHLGCFATLEEAARAYDRAARIEFGEFAYLNFPDVKTEQESVSTVKSHT